jgi:hypothetical protein
LAIKASISARLAADMSNLDLLDLLRRSVVRAHARDAATLRAQDAQLQRFGARAGVGGAHSLALLRRLLAAAADKVVATVLAVAATYTACESVRSNRVVPLLTVNEQETITCPNGLPVL